MRQEKRRWRWRLRCLLIASRRCKLQSSLKSRHRRLNHIPRPTRNRVASGRQLPDSTSQLCCPAGLQDSIVLLNLFLSGRGSSACVVR